MLKKGKPSTQSSFLMPTLHEQCDPRHTLRKLGERIPWRDFEEAFGEAYHVEGRPAKPVRLMVGLLLLKQMYDQSDEDVVDRWVENSSWAAILRDERFSMGATLRSERSGVFPATDRAQGVALILAVSAQRHGAAGQRERSGCRQHRAGEECELSAGDQAVSQNHPPMLEACP